MLVVLMVEAPFVLKSDGDVLQLAKQNEKKI